MSNTSAVLKRGVLAAVVSVFVGVGQSAVANDAWYVGGGYGVTTVDPEPRNTNLYVQDDEDSGFKVFIGKDITDRISVEGYYADLGDAAIHPAGSIGYEVYGITGLYRFYNGDDFVGNQPVGLSVFGLAGVGAMANDADRVTYTRENDVHLHWGVGAEYGFGGGFSARADLDFYDKDAAMASVSVQKRFGGTDDSVVYGVPSRGPSGPISPNVGSVVTAAKLDSDYDGVLDHLDQCDGTPAGVRVNSVGCPQVEKSHKTQEAGYYLGRVYFAVNSSYLSHAARGTLDRVAEFLKSRPEITVRAEGHTDSTESEKYNQWLSERRAKRVKDYLVMKGISPRRLMTIGYGELRPAASNADAEGRQRNRRTEFNVVAQ